MDIEEEYHNIFLYKSEKKYPSTVEREQRNNWKKKCEKYIIENNKLYYIHPKHKLVEVIRAKIQKEDILTELHIENGAHLGINRMRKRICQNYYWKTIQADVIKYIKGCNHCIKTSYQRNQNIKYSQEIRSITQEKQEPQIDLKCVTPFQFEPEFKYYYLDILRSSEQTHSGYKYIAVLTNKNTKWAEAELLKEVTAASVESFICQNIYRYGYPISLTLSGSCTEKDLEFQDKIMDKLKSFLEKHFFEVTTDTQTFLYNESFNNLLNKFITNLPHLKYNWDLHITKMLLSYNSFPQYNESPYYKTFNKHYCLSVSSDEYNLWQWTLKILQHSKVNVDSDIQFNFS